jgi:hypothetical protein
MNFSSLLKCNSKFDVYSAQKEKFRIEIYDEITGFQKEFNELFSNQFSLPVGNVLNAIQSAALKDFQFKYALIFKGESLFALLNFQLLSVSKKHYPDFSSISAAACNLYKIFSGRKYLGLVSGHLFITDFPSFACKGEHNDFLWLKEKVVSKLASLLDVDVVLLKDISSSEEQFWKDNKKFSLLKDDFFMEIVLNPEWKNIEDYRKALTKKYAARIQKMQEYKSVFEVKILDLELLKKHLLEIGQLYQQVVDRSSVKMGILNSAYFLNLKEELNNQIEYYGYFYQNKLQAFASFLKIGNQLELYYIGLNYNHPIHKDLYPMIMLDGLEKSINEKFEKFRLGRTALEAKAILGAKPRQIKNLVHFRNRWLRYMMNYLMKAAEAERGEQWKLRNPFKSEVQIETLLKQ